MAYFGIIILLIVEDVAQEGFPDPLRLRSNESKIVVFLPRRGFLKSQNGNLVPEILVTRLPFNKE